MKKFLIVTLLALTVFSVSLFPMQKQGDKIILRASDDHVWEYPTVQGLDIMARLVNMWTDGRIEIKIYPSAVLGSEKETIEQTQMGIIDINRTSISPLTSLYDKLNVIALPYLYRDREHMWKVLNGEIGQGILEELEQVGLVGLAYMDSGARSFYAKKPIYSPEDMNGMVVRVQKSELMMDVVTALGAKPTPMAFEEVYTALQTGVIDAAENNPPSYLETSHYEVAPYFSLDEHSMVPEMIYMSKVTWDKLSEEDRKIIKMAAQAAQEAQIKLWIEQEKLALEKVEESGVTIIHPDKQPFVDAMEKVYQKYGSDYAELIEQIQSMK
ncbi:C4-dicarboxylate ABC transporter [Petrotoga sp. 9PW.55.5.1]|nr:TRAP transporter substrate-binding protein [Petrotoga sp. 9PW.55.5.1]RAO99259.1 C4-dicarboxylate ABC transporter [Petrotoga sp. 9PW.55.5.1]